MLYVRTLYVLETEKAAKEFNAEFHSNDIYTEAFAIYYGELLNGIRFETAIIRFNGVRNSDYERHLAQFQRNDISRGFEN